MANTPDNRRLTRDARHQLGNGIEKMGNENEDVESGTKFGGRRTQTHQQARRDGRESDVGGTTNHQPTPNDIQRQPRLTVRRRSPRPSTSSTDFEAASGSGLVRMKHHQSRFGDDAESAMHARSHCDCATPNYWVRDAGPGERRRREKKSREGEEKKGQGPNEPRSPVRRADVKGQS